jgi:hypothetical protein
VPFKCLHPDECRGRRVSVRGSTLGPTLSAGSGRPVLKRLHLLDQLTRFRTHLDYRADSSTENTPLILEAPPFFLRRCRSGGVYSVSVIVARNRNRSPKLHRNIGLPLGEWWLRRGRLRTCRCRRRAHRPRGRGEI